MLLPVCVFGQVTVDEINFVDQATLAWAELTTDINGLPLADTDIISYNVFVYDAAQIGIIDDQDSAQLISMGSSTILPELELNFAGFDRLLYVAGVQYQVTDGLGVITTSDIGWSYNSASTNPTLPFGFIPLQGVLVLPLPMLLHIK